VPPIADGLEQRLDPRVVSCDRVGAGVLILITVPPMLGAAVIIAVVEVLPFLLRALLAAVLVLLGSGVAWLAWVVPLLRYRHASYRVDARGIEIRRGVWWRSVVDVPRSRIQHTDVSQGPVERHFGLATLHIFTAGTEHAEVRLPGLEHGRALAIRDHVMAGSSDDAV
jgi:membrane protein YdbS with pleckstrin-like domain